MLRSAPPAPGLKDHRQIRIRARQRITKLASLEAGSDSNQWSH
jgi:hypothetical protein